ncbi:hypothetical protein VTH06DRAFT_7413 [Thermothelomyces fergusii]
MTETANGHANGVSSKEPAEPSKPPLYPKSKLSLVDRFIDEPRSLKVAVIGGGLAGILAGILLPAKVPNIQLTIYEKNHDFGGTWLENVYPGVRCDIPSHVYQSTFEPKRDWTDQFSPGAEIRDYWQEVARKHDVYRLARFRHRVEAADWDADGGVWRLTVRDLGADETTVESADVVLTAIGRFNAWRMPDYPGMDEYRGLLRHASDWDPSFDPRGKRVAVIGNGASGIQLVANLQKVVARLDHYARNRTWIAASWAGDERTLEPQPIPKELQESFRDDRTYLAFRKELEDKYWRRFSGFFRGSDLNREMRDRFVDIMRRRLAKKPELLADMIPDFSPNCRRLTPGPGYLEALTEDNVDYVRTPIRRFTATGIETEDGRVREVDAVFCATGANVDLVPPFPIRARGRDLRDLVEVQLTYYAKVLRKMAREGIRALQPSRRAADDFVAYADAFFATTVLADGCSSWYNGGRPGARVHGVWPGSAGHVTAVRREPRWEDWEYEYLDPSGNRFAWYFGNGWTRREQDPASDMTPYLKLPAEIDLRDIHESWWDLP